jgi:hypothetical protein
MVHVAATVSVTSNTTDSSQQFRKAWCPKSQVFHWTLPLPREWRNDARPKRRDQSITLGSVMTQKTVI